MSQIGRIGGGLLQPNLVRNGHDLAVETDLLYLKVSPIVKSIVPQDNQEGDPNYDSALPDSLQGTGIGINTDVPVYDLDVRTDVFTVNSIVDNEARINNHIIQGPTSTFTTSVGPIHIRPVDSNPLITIQRMRSDDLDFNDNTISSTLTNQSIDLRPNGVGTIELEATTNITGNLYVSGNIGITGNLSKQGNLIIGDDVIDAESLLPENDTVDFNTPFGQHLLPGQDLTYDLGVDQDDSSPARWRQLYAPDWTNIGTLRPESMIVSDQISIDGVNSEIFSLQSNDDVELLPHTGRTQIEGFLFELNDITNLSTSQPAILASTGRGYYKFDGTNAMIFPAGDSSTRPSNPELGDTRWNTDEAYLEVFDGSVYISAVGGGGDVTQEIQEDLANLYSLILG